MSVFPRCARHMSMPKFGPSCLCRQRYHITKGGMRVDRRRAPAEMQLMWGLIWRGSWHRRQLVRGVSSYRTTEALSPRSYCRDQGLKAESSFGVEHFPSIVVYRAVNRRTGRDVVALSGLAFRHPNTEEDYRKDNSSSSPWITNDTGYRLYHPTRSLLALVKGRYLEGSMLSCVQPCFCFS
jgi:hypothetical protein